MAAWMGDLIKIELTREGLLVYYANHYTTRGTQTYSYTYTHTHTHVRQDTNCTATCPLSRNLFKLGEPDMQDIAGEAEMNS